MMRTKIVQSFGIFSCALFVGCVAMDPIPNDPAYAPVTPQSLIPPPPANGSLFNPGYGLALFEDRTARRVGDIITILLSESTAAKKESGTNIKKNNDVSVDEPTIFGTNAQFGIPRIANKILQDTSGLGLATDLASERKFTGESDSDQSNELSGTITATVTEVLPNGVLVVRGEKWITLNRGDEFVRIRGLVRPQDVNPDNTVYSSRLADARISYSGTGDIADANQMGWMSKMFNGPYWPF